MISKFWGCQLHDFFLESLNGFYKHLIGDFKNSRDIKCDHF